MKLLFEFEDAGLKLPVLGVGLYIGKVRRCLRVGGSCGQLVFGGECW